MNGGGTEGAGGREKGEQESPSGLPAAHYDYRVSEDAGIPSAYCF